MVRKDVKYDDSHAKYEEKDEKRKTFMKKETLYNEKRGENCYVIK